MLSLTRKADYAFVVMAELARRYPQQASAREMAEAVGVSLPMLTNVLHHLLHHDLVMSTKGAKGGYRLARMADQISLADMIDAIEGPPRLTACCGAEASSEMPAEERDCELELSCRIKAPVRRIHQGLRDYLSSVTLEYLAFDHQPVQIGLPKERKLEAQPLG